MYLPALQLRTTRRRAQRRRALTLPFSLSAQDFPPTFLRFSTAVAGCFSLPVGVEIHQREGLISFWFWKKLKKRKKGKDDNDFYAVAECGSEVQILVQQEDLQGGVHTSDGVADEKNNLNALELEDVEVAGDGAQRLDDLGLEDSLSTLFTRSGRKSRQVPEKDAEGVEVSCSHDDEVVDKGLLWLQIQPPRAPKGEGGAQMEEMKNACDAGSESLMLGRQRQKDSFLLHDPAAPANDVNMADLAAPLDYEGKGLYTPIEKNKVQGSLEAKGWPLGVPRVQVATEHDAPEVVEVPELNESHQMESFSIQGIIVSVPLQMGIFEYGSGIEWLQNSEEKNLGMSTEGRDPSLLSNNLDIQCRSYLDSSVGKVEVSHLPEAPEIWNLWNNCESGRVESGVYRKG
ncbi:hypothetical protein HU200_010158 [Digitaria exilis]|uniref:Uncharacterized protein n=1 Tax=Digitaria exilis TaxID=1010633 RepID=A0A835KQ74_9POAL|nr:hypothetical protein HU200_010158 [Digitaria exilis]